MMLLVLALLQQVAPENPGYEALMLRVPQSAVGDCMVFIFEKDKQVQLGFYLMDGDADTKTSILHLSTFLERYRASANEKLLEDVNRLKLDHQTIEKLNLAIHNQMSQIERRVRRLSTEVENTGLVTQFKVQSKEVTIACALLAAASESINSAGTLYTKVLATRATTETQDRVKESQLRLWKGGFTSSVLSDPAWHAARSDVP